MKRTIAIFLCLLLCLQVLAGCQKKGETTADPAVTTGPGGETTSGPTSGETTAVVVDEVAAPVLSGVKTMPADGIGTPGVDFTMLESGAVEGWDDRCPAPFFNPLGTRKLYSMASADLSALRNAKVETLDGSTPKSFSIEGTEWTLKISDERVSRNWILYKAREMGAVIYETAWDRAVFYCMEGETVRWWVLAELTNYNNKNEAYIRIFRTVYAPPGQTVTIRPADSPQTKIYRIYTDCVPGRLQSATVTMKGEPDKNRGVLIRAHQDAYINGVLQSITSQIFTQSTWVTNTAMSDRFVFDNVPIVDGMLQWTIELDAYGSTRPDEITFSIDDVADVPAVEWGEQLGLVRIIGAADGGGARLERPWDQNVRHGVFDQYNTLGSPWQDQDGNYCFTAPAGYYTLTLAENVCSGNVVAHQSQIQLVPVSAGKITTVTLPPELRATYGEMSKQFGSFDRLTGSIDIQSAVDSGDTATVSLVVKDPLERELSSALADFTVMENGLAGKVVKVEQAAGAVDVVLVLDSSGSMKNDITAAVSAAKRFVESLPDNASITLVQFASSVTRHNGSSKAEALAALDTVKASGSTVMYDATAAALQILQGKKQPYVVVFSDGADSSEPNIEGTGSKLPLASLVSQIQASGVTVLTIGFGVSHDPKALKTMSSASPNGAYFAAADPSGLDSAFAAVAARFGNQFFVTYERPTAVVDQDSDVPVVSIMMDTSGSMDMDPASSAEDVGFRLNRVKNVFHDFVLKLPDGVLMQYNTFFTPIASTPRSHYIQVTTDDKAPVLRGIASVQAGGGTPIVEALNMALLELDPIPSSKRVLVFMTDAALAVKSDASGSQQAKFEEVLGDIKKSGIRVLFAGLGGADYAAKYDGVFKYAADLAGGDYVITSDVKVIAARLDALLAQISTPVSTGETVTTLSVALDTAAADGSRLKYAASRDLTDFSVRQSAGQTVRPGVVDVVLTSDPYVDYDREAALELYGSDSPTQDSIITMRTDFDDFSASNDFAELTVSQAYFLERFRGIQAPAGQQFLALQSELKFARQNAGAAETGYMIPSIFQHFYVSCNNGRPMPASKATWLAEDAFADPGDAAVTVTADRPAEGILVFLVDKQDRDSLKQLSVHLYDTEHGHIALGLIGGVPENLLQIADLPTSAPVRITDAFSLTVRGLTDVTSLSGIQLSQQNQTKSTSFRVLEADFTSQVQALLNIDPNKRFYYAIATDNGTLLTRMSGVVDNLPLGFTGDTMLAPGSANSVRMPFVLPNALLSAGASIYGDLRDGSLGIPVSSGAVYATASVRQASFSHEYFDLTVNSLRPVSANSRTVVLDFTVTDKKDGMGVSGFDSILALELNNSTINNANSLTDPRLSSASKVVLEAVNRKGMGNFTGADLGSRLGQYGIKYPDLSATRRLIFGASQDQDTWGVFDGQSRRGILIFSLPAQGAANEWTLTSSLLPGMKVAVENVVYANPELLAEKPVIEVDNSFETQLAKAVTAAVNAWRASRPAGSQTQTVTLADEDRSSSLNPSPALTLYGSQVIKSVMNDQAFHHVMNSMDWIPAHNDGGNYLYAPESVITQGWGTENDLFMLAKTLLARLGYRPQQRTFKLNEVGKQNLRQIYGIEDVPSSLPALAYTNAEGEGRVYVPVLGHDISEMYGLGVLSSENVHDVSGLSGTIRVYAVGEVTGRAAEAARQAAIGGFGAALGGSEGIKDGTPIIETVNLLQADFAMDQIGLDEFDLSFVSLGKSEDGVHDKVTAVTDTRVGRLTSPALWIDTGSYKLQKVVVELTCKSAASPADKQTRTIYLEDDEALTGLYMSFAYNTPEISAKAAQAYDAAVAGAALTASDPTDYENDRWLGRATLNRLIKALGDYDDELATDLAVVTGRRQNPIGLAFTLRLTPEGTRASVDLMNHANQIVQGNADAGHAYNLLLGLFASQAEADAISSGGGESVLDVWAAMAQEEGFIVIDSDYAQRSHAAEVLSVRGYPALLCERLLQKGDNMENIAFIVPTGPGQENGESRWAWLELDIRTYSIVSMFDNGERAGMSEYVMAMQPEKAAETMDGVLVGVVCSQSSIATYSLVMSNYADIKANAELLVYYTYLQILKFEGMSGDWPKYMDNVYKSIADEYKKEAMGLLKEKNGIDLAEIESVIKGDKFAIKFSKGFKLAIESFFKKKFADPG